MFQLFSSMLRRAFCHHQYRESVSRPGLRICVRCGRVSGRLYLLY